MGKKLPQDPTIRVPGGRKDTSEAENPRRELKRERGRAEAAGEGSQPPSCPWAPKPTARGPAAESPHPSAPRRACSRDTAEASGKGGGGEAGEGSREPGAGAGAGLRRRAEPQEGGAGQGAIDAACRPMTSELGRASGQWAVPLGAGGGH